MDATTPAEFLRDAEEQHGHYEPSGPPHQWPDWCAAYIVARRQGRDTSEALAAARP